MTVEITITAEAGAEEATPHREAETAPSAEASLPAAPLARAAFFAALRRKADARLAAFG